MLRILYAVLLGLGTLGMLCFDRPTPCLLTSQVLLPTKVLITTPGDRLVPSFGVPTAARSNPVAPSPSVLATQESDQRTDAVGLLDPNTRSAGQPGTVREDPLGILQGQIDNKKIYDAFVAAGQGIINEKRGLDVAAIQQSVRRPARSNLLCPASSVGDDSFGFENVAKSSLLFGTLYDCGKCEEMHGNIAGGVVVSDDGLCLTNHHVLERRDEDTRVIFAMDYTGRGYAIQEVLAANRMADVALVRLQGTGPFYPAPIATNSPLPNTPAFVLSHPSSEFFVLTQGVVSRHVTLTQRRGKSTWLEVTAPFGAGSSGSGVFDDRGRLIGLVSRISPIFRGAEQIAPPAEGEEPRLRSIPYAELILRRCVTTKAIRECFREEDLDSNKAEQ
ncbi:MAG: trypsin-like peptidase domain-containing protein [Planctomycetaceae bacterium]|nr:trypsin-like peptidase domain-containing protein [Planctomycetaceae bacterium]